MKWKQSLLTGLAVAALVAVTSGCTADTAHTPDPADSKKPVKAGPAGASPRACANGTYEWFNVLERDVLTGLAAPQTLGKGGGKLTEKLRVLSTPETSVTAKGPVLDSGAVLLALARHTGAADPDVTADELAFADAGRPVPDVNDGVDGVDGPGKYVEYAFARVVTGDFRYTCADDTSTVGRATGWTVDGNGGLECSTPIEEKRATVAREAARLSCGPGSPAARKP